jgi:hypothetical protein
MRYSLNPFAVISELVSVIEPFIENKHKIKVSLENSAEKVESSKIVVAVERLDVDHKSGEGGVPVSTDPKTATVKISQIKWYRLNSRWTVFSQSLEEAYEYAWDLILSIENMSGPFATKHPGYNQKFIGIERTPLSSSNNQKLSSVIIRFEHTVKVDFYQQSRALKGLQIVPMAPVSVVGRRIVRTNSENSFYLSMDNNKLVTSIHLITVSRNGKRVVLRKGIDYEVGQQPDSLGVYIIWLEDGLAPVVNEEFQVDYEASHLVQAPSIFTREE